MGEWLHIKPEDFERIFASNTNKGSVKDEELLTYDSPVQLMAYTALNARSAGDPKWKALVYRLQCWSVQHKGVPMTEQEIVDKLEVLAV